MVDRSIIEFFSNGGEKSSTLVFYPETMIDTVVVRAGGLNEGIEISARVYEIMGTWPGGTVEPNGTDVYMPNGTSGSGSGSGMKKRATKGEYNMPALPLGGGRVLRA